MPSASIYVRNSKAIGARNMSQAGMVAECRELAADEGLDVIAVHIDNGKSGAIRDRPEFEAWLDDARHGRAQVLISWAGDRLTREGANVAARILDVQEGKDPDTGALVRPPVRLLTYDDGIDSDQGDYYRRRLLDGAENARAERGRMSRRSIATRKRLLAAGKWPSGQPPYGTRLDAERRLEVDPEEREVLRDVAQTLLRGESMWKVLLSMNDRGLTTRRGNPWTRSSLTTTLESETSRKLIFTLAESRALETRLHPKPGLRPTGGRPVQWLLSGYATCAGCGRTLTTSRDKKRGVTRYVCPTTSTVAPCKARATIRADRVDEYVTEAYLARMGGRIQPKVVTVLEADVDIDAAERAYQEAETRARDTWADEDVQAAREAKQALEAALSKPVVRRRLTIGHDRLGDLWEQADLPGRAALLRRATEGISISRSTRPAWDESRIQIDWTHTGDPVEVAS